MLQILERLLGRDDVTDVLLSPATGLWVDDARGLHRIEGVDVTERSARTLAETLLARGGRRIDYLSPVADVRLANGVRVHAVLAPVASSGTSVSIRVARHAGLSLAHLAETNMFTPGMGAFLHAIIRQKQNLIISGATGTGKTTLLGALLSAVPHDERIIVVEDVSELRIDHPHVVSLEARQPNAEGLGGVNLHELVRHALRMRPTRLVVGECRGPELLDFLTALNTGHSGGGITLHANGVGEVPSRLEALAHTHGLDPGALARLVAGAIDHVVHVERRAGVRQVTAIGQLVQSDGNLRVALREVD